MTTELFGVAAGQQMATMDQAKLDEQSALMQLHSANARHLISQDAQAELMMKMLAEPDQTQQAKQGPPGGVTVPPAAILQAAAQGADPLTQVTNKIASDANKLAKAGFLAQAEGAAKTVAELTLKRQQQSTAASQAAYRDAQASHMNLQEINALASGVTDQGSFNQAKMLWMGRHPGQPIPQELQAYDPRLIEAVLNGTKEGMDRLKLEMTKMEDDSKEADRKSRVDFREFRRKQLAASATAKAEQDAVKAKAGKDVGAPTRAETDIALRAIEDAYKEADLPATEKLRAADDVASRAKAIRKANPGIDAATATQQALEEARPYFETVAKTYMGLSLGGKETRYKRGGAVAPIALPSDKSALKIGQTYTLKNGKAGKWTGQGFAVEGAP